MDGSIGSCEEEVLNPTARVLEQMVAWVCSLGGNPSAPPPPPLPFFCVSPWHHAAPPWRAADSHSPTHQPRHHVGACPWCRREQIRTRLWCWIWGWRKMLDVPRCCTRAFFSPFKSLWFDKRFCSWCCNSIQEHPYGTIQKVHIPVSVTLKAWTADTPAHDN